MNEKQSLPQLGFTTPSDEVSPPPCPVRFGLKTWFVGTFCFSICLSVCLIWGDVLLEFVAGAFLLLFFAGLIAAPLLMVAVGAGLLWEKCVDAIFKR